MGHLTVLIDYESGNLHSAEKAFQRMARETDAGEVIVTSRAEDVARATKIRNCGLLLLGVAALYCLIKFAS